VLNMGFRWDDGVNIIVGGDVVPSYSVIGGVGGGGYGAIIGPSSLGFIAGTRRL
jgi:hypothetical protein